ncbi:hypothetical protein EDC04DRAFT_2893689 [Pisolithus marmoratus]|nr:hypothetical protein EDC04DRAFT_2893689 [Pisolithus marmoratus]
MLGISTDFDSTIPIISEWMPLGSAHTYVQNTENDPRPLLQDIASGLHYLHSHVLGPVVHGDVKGLNVMISNHGRALLTDFDLSTLNVSTFSMTADTVRGFTLHWTAPECLDDSPASIASDVWAFGMTTLVLNRIMCGELPARPAYESTLSRLTDAWWEICVSCWGRDPSSRPTMKDTLEKVRTAIVCESPSPAERLAVLLNLVNSLEERFWKEGVMWDLSEAITYRRAALSLMPPEHPERLASLAGLAKSLDQRYQKQGAMEDLTEMITHRRAALDLVPPGQPERPMLLTTLARNLDELFRKKGAMEDLTETISLQRSALELSPSEYPERLVPLVDLANYLDMQFKKSDILADLDKKVYLLRAILECTLPASPERSISLVDLATCLCERYRRLGALTELHEAIACVRDATAFCPPEHRKSIRECLVNCVELKIKNWNPLVAVANSPTAQIISNIADEIVTTLPLRLLATETGDLCDRDAQMLRFERSSEYNELLSSASIWDRQELEAKVRKAVSRFFRYAILSHRWGRGEPSLHDVKGTNVYGLDSTDGVVKLQRFCVLALKEEVLWAWSDTCCIDKGSSAELQEAIGSMFSWYRRSALTIVYLSDVSDTASFTKSVWFKRGWTLQELLASRTAIFYMRDWTLYMNSTTLNHKADDAVLKDLQKATGIGKRHLKNFRPGMDNARSRLQWASARRTTKPEDVAYSLFGIFHLHLPVLYGESSETALGRLLAEIISQSGDVSVLDWVGQRSTFHSCFPATLQPYQTVPSIQSTPSSPTGPNDVDTARALELYGAIVKLPRPRFINRRLVLPSFVHPITAVKVLEAWDSPSCHEYEIHASGLMPLRVTLSVNLQKGSRTDLPYTLIRPWHPNLFAPGAKDDMDAIQMLLERFEQPFHTLLLRALPHNEYKRIASNCEITARAKDVASVVNSDLRVLEIV